MESTCISSVFFSSTQDADDSTDDDNPSRMGISYGTMPCAMRFAYTHKMASSRFDPSKCVICTSNVFGGGRGGGWDVVVVVRIFLSPPKRMGVRCTYNQLEIRP